MQQEPRYTINSAMLRLAPGLLISLLVCFALNTPLEGAEILGTVTDLTNGRLPGVLLQLTNSETGSSRSVRTSRLGKYTLSSVQPGHYDLSASLSGFKTEIRKGLRLAVGEQLVVNFQLTVGSISEEVVVVSEGPEIDITSTEISNLIDGKQVENLPLNGRDWVALSELSPAVVKARSTGYFSAANMQAGRISVSGQRPNATNFMLDGTDINVYSGARPPGSVAQGLVLGVEAIKEFRIVTSNYGADYGVKSGGLVEAVSNSGTNHFHGSLYWFNRSGNLDARDFFDPGEASNLSRNQFGASLGGPITRNRTFIFVNYERFRENKEETSSGLVPNLAARGGMLPIFGTDDLERIDVHPKIRPYLEFYPFPNGPDFGNGTALWSGTGRRNLEDNFLTARIDHVLSAGDSFFGRYTVDDSGARLPFSSSDFPGFARSPKGRDHLVTLHHNHYFTATFLNNLSFGFNRSGRTSSLENPNPGGLAFSIIPGAPFGSLRVGGLGLVGYTPRPVSDLTQNVYQLTDSASLIRGIHSLKLGFELRRFQINNNQEIDTSGIVTFPNLRSLLENRPDLYTGAGEGADFVRGYRYSQYALFIQDKVDVARSLSLTLGLRYEPWSNVTEADGKLSILLDPLGASGPEDFQPVDQLFITNPARRNWAPRVGFAWDLCGDGKTSLRGGFGIFHDSPLNGSLLGPVTAAPPYVQLLTVQRPSFPDILAAASGPVSPILSPWVLEYEDFTWPAVSQFHLSLQRTFFLQSLLSFTYSGSRGRHLISRRELNSKIPTILDDGQKYFPEDAPRYNQSLGSISLQATDSNSWYDSFQVLWNRRFAQGFSLLASYTFAKSIDEASPTMTLIETTGHPKIRMDSEDLARDKGPSAFDVRHSFTTSFLWEIPVGEGGAVLGLLFRDWQVGCILNLASGHPFTPLISFNNSRTGISGSTSRADRPSLKPGYDKNPKLGKVDIWYDPNSFELPEPGFLGNLGRNTLTGPGYSNADLALTREFRVSKVSDDFKVQFRAEFFNLLNHPNFDLPGNSGSVTAASYLFTDSNGQPNIGATRPIRTVSNSREIQFGLRLAW